MYARQFLIARDPRRIPESYEHIAFGSWHVGLAPDLEHVRVELPDARNLLVFGHPIDCFGGIARLAATGDIEALYDVAGSYVALLETAHGVVLYLDASGSLPAVYAPELGIVAANPSLIHEVEQDAELVRSFPIEDNAFFPFGLTPKASVKRLLPNHRLVLESMTVARHWPLAMQSGARTPDENVAFIRGRLRTLLSAIAAQRRVSIPLTAGYDSRALIACSPIIANVSCFTSLIDGDALEDARLGRKLADALGVRFQAAAYIEPSPAERERWLDSTGRCVGGRASYNFKTVASVTDAEQVLCLGLAGEVGRCFYGSRVTRSTPLTAELVLRKLRLPLNPIGLAAAASWLDGLRGFDAQQILDLLYIEVRLGCWAGPQMIADSRCAYRVIPFNQRPIYEHALDVPYELRRAEFIPGSIVRQEQPALAQFPYNPAARTLRRRVSSLVDRVLVSVDRLTRPSPAISP